MIISCDYLNVSLADEHIGEVTIPTKVIEYNQKVLQADKLIRLKYLNQIKLLQYIITVISVYKGVYREPNMTLWHI
jgi:hypothetical protein